MRWGESLPWGKKANFLFPLLFTYIIAFILFRDEVYATQADLKLMSSSDPPTSPSHTSETMDKHHPVNKRSYIIQYPDSYY